MIPDDVRDEWVDYLAVEFSKVRTGGSVFMDGSHNPRPSERQAASLFVRDFLAAVEKHSKPTLAPRTTEA